MARVKIRLNRSGVRELLKGEELRGECEKYARSIQSAAGPDYEMETRSYPERSGAAVYPANESGYYDNLRNNTLVKSLGGVGGGK